jgi:hypothetical protein
MNGKLFQNWEAKKRFCKSVYFIFFIKVTAFYHIITLLEVIHQSDLRKQKTKNKNKNKLMKTEKTKETTVAKVNDNRLIYS